MPDGNFGSQAAIVVFVDRAECLWLRPLRRGFRHCFVALQQGDAWLVCDSLKNRLELTLLSLPRSFDLAAHYVEHGHRVLAGRLVALETQPAFAPSLLTCVTVAKRILVMRAPQVWTPWQLFTHLLRTHPGVWRKVEAYQLGQASSVRDTAKLDIKGK